MNLRTNMEDTTTTTTDTVQIKIFHGTFFFFKTPKRSATSQKDILEKTLKLLCHKLLKNICMYICIINITTHNRKNKLFSFTTKTGCKKKGSSNWSRKWTNFLGELLDGTGFIVKIFLYWKLKSKS